jgi:hypothetical protein
MGKGARSQPVKDAFKQHKGVYLGAIGGAGAVLSRFVKRVEIVAYEDLGTEAIRRLEVEGFPAIVVNDCHGGDPLPGRREGLCTGGNMSSRVIGQSRPAITASHLRTDPWWVLPIAVFIVLGTFLIYSTWAAFQNAHYFVDPYLSPFYSPVSLADVPAQELRVRAAGHPPAGHRAALARVSHPRRPGLVPTDLLLLPQGVLPLVLAHAARLRGARPQARILR